MNEICTVCSKKREGVLPQWWSLTQYHGVNGIYCPACFEKVRHKDARPVHPIAFRNALRKMDGSAPIKAHSKSQYKRLSAQGANVLPEPVAWLVTYGGLTHIAYTKPTQVVDTHYQPLYAAPPRREWVGLTEEKIDELACAMVKGNKSVNWLCGAIEAKLKEKNT